MVPSARKKFVTSVVADQTRAFWVTQYKGQMRPWLSLPNVSAAFPVALNHLLNFNECPVCACYELTGLGLPHLDTSNFIHDRSSTQVCGKPNILTLLRNSGLFLLLNSSSKPAIYSLLPGSQLRLGAHQKSSVCRLIINL